MRRTSNPTQVISRAPSSYLLLSCCCCLVRVVCVCVPCRSLSLRLRPARRGGPQPRCTAAGARRSRETRRDETSRRKRKETRARKERWLNQGGHSGNRAAVSLDATWHSSSRVQPYVSPPHRCSTLLLLSYLVSVCLFVPLCSRVTCAAARLDLAQRRLEGATPRRSGSSVAQMHADPHTRISGSSDEPAGPPRHTEADTDRSAYTTSTCDEPARDSSRPTLCS